MRRSSLRLFPLGDHLRRLSAAGVRADAKASLSVAMLDLPQGMAYATVACLPLQFGTMCSAVASCIGAVFGSSRYLMLGPTNATAFMVFSYFANHTLADRMLAMPMLVLRVGVLLLIGSVMRIAELVQYVSRTVVIAYVTGAAMLIIGNQLAAALGLAWQGGDAAQPRTLPGILWQTLVSLPNLRWECLLTAAGASGVYAFLRWHRPRWPSLAIALVIASLGVLAARSWGIDVPTYANASFGLKDLIPHAPDLAPARLLASFQQLFGLATALAFLSILESVSMSKTLASGAGESVDTNQDMLALGLANVGCAWLAGMPCSASLTRSALNHQAGALTPLASLLNGLICLAAALTLGPLVGYIPRAALAALIICVAISVMSRRHMLVCLSATGSDALTFVVTLAATVMMPLHEAIFIGVAVSLLLYLRKASQPSLTEYQFNPDGHLAEAPESARRPIPQ